MLAWGGSICWVGQGPVGYVGPPFLTASAASLLSSLFCFLLLTLSQAVSSSLGGLSIHLAAGEASAFLPVTPRAKIFPDSALPDLTPCSTRMPTQRPCSCCAHAVCPHRIDLCITSTQRAPFTNLSARGITILFFLPLTLVSFVKLLFIFH